MQYCGTSTTIMQPLVALTNGWGRSKALRNACKPCVGHITTIICASAPITSEGHDTCFVLSPFQFRRNNGTPLPSLSSPITNSSHA
mmetsp:Transcript_10089/g.21807  ORF Transcript_10089/g.21807 Transcript_10089/m.21807 type:complete len:86 (-) Transcript_10089:135-392(-)